MASSCALTTPPSSHTSPPLTAMRISWIWRVTGEIEQVDLKSSPHPPLSFYRFQLRADYPALVSHIPHTHHRWDFTDAAGRGRDRAGRPQILPPPLHSRSTVSSCVLIIPPCSPTSPTPTTDRILQMQWVEGKIEQVDLRSAPPSPLSFRGFQVRTNYSPSLSYIPCTHCNRDFMDKMGNGRDRAGQPQIRPAPLHTCFTAFSCTLFIFPSSPTPPTPNTGGIPRMQRVAGKIEQADLRSTPLHSHSMASSYVLTISPSPLKSSTRTTSGISQIQRVADEIEPVVPDPLYAFPFVAI